MQPSSSNSGRTGLQGRSRQLLAVVCIALVAGPLFVVKPDDWQDLVRPSPVLTPPQKILDGNSSSTHKQSGPPQLASAVEQAANDVGEAATQHGVADLLTLSPTHGSGQLKGGSQSCPEVVSQFKAAHTAARKASVDAGVQADAWTGHHPLCGVHVLYNYTQLILSADEIPESINAGEPWKFRIRSCAPATTELFIEDGCPDVKIDARLFGPSIIAGTVSLVPASMRRSRELCEWEVAFLPHDAGKHSVEVRLVWLDGLGPERLKKRSSPITLRKTHSKFGKKPHQRYVYNGPCEAQTLLTPNSAVNVRGTSPSEVLPRCKLANVSGRWLQHDNSKSCAPSGPCIGDPSTLNDAKPFNKDLVWAPLSCRYEMWSRGKGPKNKCTAKSGTLLMMGDSTTREYAQNLRLFDLRAAGLSLTYANWRIEHKWFSRKVVVESLGRLRGEIKQQRPVVLALNLGPLHLLAGTSTADWEFYVDEWVKLMANSSTTFPFLEKKVFLAPTVIHYATSDMTEQRMALWSEYARSRLIPIGFDVVDGHSVTAGRAESSWDGVHHAAERGKAQMKHARPSAVSPMLRWNGGVSVMLTQMLLNLLCPEG